MGARTKKMLDINLFREEKGGNPELVRASQRARYAPVEDVDRVIELDVAWRKVLQDCEQARKSKAQIQKKITPFKKAKEEVPAELLAEKDATDKQVIELETQMNVAAAARDKVLKALALGKKLANTAKTLVES